MRTDIRCLGMCRKYDDKGKFIQDGFLIEIIPNSGRLFCDTTDCKFAYIDEHKREVWIGGQMPQEVLERIT